MRPRFDGSHILANLSRPYAMFISDPAKQPVFLFGFLLVFVVAWALWEYAYRVTHAIVGLVQTVGL